MGFLGWLDKKAARWLSMRMGTDIGPIKPEIMISPHRRPTPSTIAKMMDDHCPCGAGWSHSREGDADKHRAWMRKDTRS